MEKLKEKRSKEFHLHEKPFIANSEPFLIFTCPCVASEYAVMLDLELVEVEVKVNQLPYNLHA